MRTAACRYKPRVAAVGAGDVAHDGAPQARSLAASGSEGLEQTLSDVRRNARSGIGNAELQSVGATLRPHLDRAACRCVFNGVKNEIIKGAVHLLGIEERRRGGGGGR